MSDPETGPPAGWRYSAGEMPGLVEAKDWSRTPLGPRGGWSQSLKMAVDMVMASAFPMALRWGPDFILIYNDSYKPILGEKHPWALGRPAREAWAEVWGELEPAHTAIMGGGKAIFADDIVIRIQRRSAAFEEAGFTISYSPVHDATVPAGVGGVFVTAIETTGRLRAEAALTEKTRALEILNRTAAIIAAETDVGRVVQAVTDAGVELVGAEFGAFFYNVLNEAGEAYMLYTLSGAPREAFEKFPMPRNTAVFGPTFAGEGIVRSDDITQDPRYGRNAPRNGMPEGHLPVRSYLAAPVKSLDGEVLGGLFFGHSRTGVYGEETEGFLENLAGQAAIAIDRARLFEAAQREIVQRARAEAELQQLNGTLEQRVAAEVAGRARTEEALRQSQKMEAVGQLTGGVAHDFNNLLTVIMGGLDTIVRSGPSEQVRIRRAAEMALLGAQRAASLTARLLAFSRRQPLQPRPLDLNTLVRDMTELLHRTLGETVELEVVLSPRLWSVEVDPNQLESAILNLAVNARDALPEGGKLTIETANVSLDESYAATDAEVVPGQYVALSVSDNGEGMSKETLARVFEPFFTTKEVGRGTGLGLSMVYGFVKQSGGHVTVYSEVGQGTSVKLYLPRHHGAGASIPVQAAEAPPGRGDEVILVVEDNDDVRAYSAQSLKELGYRVLEAQNADAALSLLERAAQVDLLFTDVVLPGRSGRSLADAALAIRPGLPVLFTTGYSRNAIVHHGRLDAGVHLLAKPFTFDQLAARVRDILDGAKRATGPTA